MLTNGQASGRMVPVGQPWRFHPGRTCVVTSTCTGHAIRPKRAIDGRGLSPISLTALSATPTRSSALGASSRLGVRDAFCWLVPFGQTSSLHPLRCRLPGVVRGLLRYSRSVRLPRSVRHRRASLDFPMRPKATAVLGEPGSPGSPSRCFRTCTV